MQKQYFSKLHNMWKDLLSSDSEEKLLRYGYKIRDSESTTGNHGKVTK